MFEKGVIITAPTTLIALLKVIALGWRGQQIADNAKRISDLGRQMYDRIRVAAEHVDTLARRLKTP